MSAQEGLAISFGQIQKEYAIKTEELVHLVSAKKVRSKDIAGKTYVIVDEKFKANISKYKTEVSEEDKQQDKIQRVEDKIIEGLLENAKELNTHQLMKLVKQGCCGADKSTKWAKIALEMINLEMKMEQSNKIPPERYYEIIKELVNAPSAKPMPVGGYTGED